MTGTFLRAEMLVNARVWAVVRYRIGMLSFIDTSGNIRLESLHGFGLKYNAGLILPGGIGILILSSVTLAGDRRSYRHKADHPFKHQNTKRPSLKIVISICECLHGGRRIFSISELYNMQSASQHVPRMEPVKAISIS